MSNVEENWDGREEGNWVEYTERMLWGKKFFNITVLQRCAVY